MELRIAPLTADDRADWERLARGYKEFYNTVVPDAGYAATWNRLLRAEDIAAIGARSEGKLVGIAHYLFHTTIWAPTTCSVASMPAVKSCQPAER